MWSNKERNAMQDCEFKAVNQEKNHIMHHNANLTVHISPLTYLTQDFLGNIGGKHAASLIWNFSCQGAHGNRSIYNPPTPRSNAWQVTHPLVRTLHERSLTKSRHNLWGRPGSYTCDLQQAEIWGWMGRMITFSGELKNSLAADSGKKFQKCYEGKNRNLAKQV